MVPRPGFKTLTTQFFTDDSARLNNNVTYAVTPSLISRFEMHDTLDGAPAGFTAP